MRFWDPFHLIHYPLPQFLESPIHLPDKIAKFVTNRENTSSAVREFSL